MPWDRIEGPAHSICLVAVFLAIAVWESLQPMRKLSVPAERRWRNHGAMLLLSGIMYTLALRLTPVAMAVIVSGSRFGVLNKAWLPLWLRCAIAILTMDAMQYWIHWGFHHNPMLWRIHQVHHSDPDYDVSTAGRFHPLEVLWTQGLHLVAIAVIAPPPLAILISLLLSETLNVAAHANARLPARIDRLLRLLLVTPDMHRIHHSQDLAEQQRNLGQTFPFWDRVFGTFLETPAAQGADFRTGLEGAEEGADNVSLVSMLVEPFRKARRTDTDAVGDPIS
jgi:sterol desaturase/sphingolipid hydroxylase (fatty acid hydroxylase superfamily)